MPHPDDQPGPLSVYRAFVVQFDAHTDVERGHLAGRLDAVQTGIMSQALRPLPGHCIRGKASQRLKEPCMRRPARARQAVAYVSRCEMCAGSCGYLLSVRHEFYRSGKAVRSQQWS